MRCAVAPLHRFHYSTTCTASLQRRVPSDTPVAWYRLGPVPYDGERAQRLDESVPGEGAMYAPPLVVEHLQLSTLLQSQYRH